jgi:hypothetical protein
MTSRASSLPCVLVDIYGVCEQAERVAISEQIAANLNMAQPSLGVGLLYDDNKKPLSALSGSLNHARGAVFN